MSATHNRGQFATMVLLGCVMISRSQPVDFFWTPSVSMDAGYEDNRFLTATSVTNTQGTAFLRLAPSIGIRALMPGGWDISLDARWGRTMYADDNMGSREDTVLRATAWHTGPRFEAGASIDAGWLADDALPDDYQAWGCLSPAALWYLGNPAWAVTAGARLALSRYDSLITPEGDGLTDTFAELRAGLQWTPSPDVTLWVEAYGEADSCNDPASDFQGAGASAGADRWMTPRLRASLWARAGIRGFPDSAMPDLGLDERHDAPVAAGLSLVHRLRPWLELSCNASWRDTGSNRDESDLSAWSASIGVTITDEIPIR